MDRPSPPVADTAQRLEWFMLPRPLRATIEQRCGSEVVEAHSRTRGFTPGFASVLECADGSTHFVKAASVVAQGMFAAAYREEGRKLARIPASVPAPPLLWVIDDDWVVLGISYVEARHPVRPWRRDDLDASLDSLEVVARELTPAPADLDLGPAADDLAGFLGHWDVLRAAPPRLPSMAARLEEAAALAGRYAAAVAGDTVVHSDLRDDNVLLDPTGTAWFCDWNFPVAGAPWLDSLLLLIGPRGDGVDVEAVIAERPLLRDVPADDLDSVIALVTAYFLKSAGDPLPRTSPYLRTHQRWQGEVCWEWLCERRGWDR